MNDDQLDRKGSRVAGFGGALVMALAGLGAGPALAQQRPQAALSAQPAPSGQFATPDGALRFVLDRSGPAALIQFEGDPEVYVLRPDPGMGAGGQQVFRTADGSIQLRVTRWGELTVFVRNDRMGAAASFNQQAPPLRPAPVAAPTFRAELQQTERAVVRRVGRQVALEAPSQVSAADNGIILDAAERAADGMAAAPQAPVRRVVLQTGPAPAAEVIGDALVITVAPQLGYAGRPSSDQIRAALEHRH